MRGQRLVYLLFIVVAVVPFSATAADGLGITLAQTPGGPAADAITLHMPVDKTEGTLPVFLRQGGDAPLANVALAATPLQDEEGDQSGASVSFGDSGDFEIPPKGEELRVDLKVAALSALGTFTATVYARRGGGNQTLATLTVKRMRKSGVLDVPAIQTARATKAHPWAQTSVTIDAQVKNNGTKAVILSTPTVSQLAVGGTTKYQASAPDLTVVRPAPGEDGAVAIEVPPGESRTIEVKLSPVKYVGAYAGTLSFNGNGVETVDEPFAFDVKESAAAPVVLILAGVGMSLWLRRQLGTGQARIVRQRRDRQLVEEITSLRQDIGDLTDKEQRLLETLERRLQDLYDDLELGQAQQADAILDEIDNKLALVPAFVNARRRVGAMRPVSLQERFRRDLEGVAAFLETPGNADKLEANRSTLAGMEQRIEEAIRDEFLARVKELEDQSTARLAKLPAVDARVRSSLDEAKRHAADGQMEAARKDFDAAQRAFAVGLADELVGSFPDPGKPPPGVSAARWPDLRKELADALEQAMQAPTGEEAVARYQEVWRRYMLEMSKALRDWADERARTNPADAEPLGAIAQLARDTARKAAAGDVPGAIESYAAAVSQYQVYQKPQAAGGRLAPGQPTMPDAATAPPYTEVPGLVGLGTTERTRGRTARGFPSVDQLTRKIKRNQWILAAIVTVAALLIGLKFLWSDDATWGDFNDYAAAFLWGLGLHQVTGTAFDVSTLGTSLTGGTGAAKP